ncbi:related to IKS1-putative serine/threonine kinase [Sporisorium reilianum SRZ2]|uniref:non-specific serine/threonine protein kinase n=1 Tax=Sporisorium reilianum (strain SRZ2) TaxID=999809 RepID=E6ZYV9_SPORE|nr:related to IKS1-putative serine/threonine kinase [Sporisorium reilianum SRZ2]
MTSPYRPSPLRLSDTSWASTGIIDEPVSGRAAGAGNAAGSSSLDLVPAPRASDLQMVLRTRDHAAYYDASSNELSLQKRSLPRSTEDASASHEEPSQAPLAPYRNEPSTSQSLLQRFRRFASLEDSSNQPICPTCARPWPLGQPDPLDTHFAPNPADRESPSFIAPNYFRLLAQATHTSTSSPNTTTTPSLPRNRFESASGSSTPLRSGASTPPERIHHAAEAQGYYARFFVELKRLGRGARGQVFLCQHVLNGNQLGKYAIKKIPVGDHAQSLLQSLNEVHLMESLHHDNLIHYQHAWIERCQLSAFAPEVPTLFVLMMAANGGSLADWISARAGDAEVTTEEAGEREAVREEQDVDVGTANPAERLKIERLKAALRQRRAKRSATATASTAPATNTAPPPPAHPHIDVEVGVHLLRTDEIYSLLTDITSGLAFLHARGILHLDIKPGNVLLHWDDDALIPRAMLSDFGSSLLLHDNWTRTRSGHTGTLEYMSPETMRVNPVTRRLDELSSKADMWSLGMILHLLVFFRLPFRQTQDVDELRAEMLGYSGFRRGEGAEGGRGDEVLLGLLERMLSVEPVKRPSCADVLQVLAAAKGKQTKSARRRPKPDAHTGVSLALYRPPTLPPLPPSSTTQTTTRHHAAPTLRAHTTAIALALLKCLSPALLFNVPTLDAVSVAIVLLALVELSHAERRVSVACWIAHVVLLGVCGWRAGAAWV